MNLKMAKIKKSFSKKWEVSLMKLENDGKKYKVTRRIPELSVSETKVFKTKKEAIEQFNEWLKD